MDGELVFNSTLSIADFKEHYNVTEVNLVENPKTGKQFFSTNVRTISGKAAKELDVEAEVVISEVSDDEETFFMLHNRAKEVNVKHKW